EKTRGLFKRGLFRGKTRRASKTASAEQSTTSLHSRSISSNLASPGNPGNVPPSIQTASTRDTRDSEVLSPGLSSDGQSMPATARQRGDSFVSSQESHISGTAGAREPAGEGAGQTGAQAGGGDFAEWVFAEGSQDAGPVGASVGSLVHVAAGGLPPIGEDGKEEELDEAADEPPVAVAQATPVADATVGDASSNKADENTDLFNDVKFDDVFGTTSSAFEPQETEAKASNSSEQPAAAASIDLDSVFSIPRSTQQAQPTLGKTTSPATHHRSASLDNDQRSHASSSANDSDTEEAMEQSFRVKFSIRDRAIEDNPD
ncbi:hypothetical protein LPJ73_009400, partial [Coemansia sp. RSA 2703]